MRTFGEENSINSEICRVFQQQKNNSIATVTVEKQAKNQNLTLYSWLHSKHASKLSQHTGRGGRRRRSATGRRVVSRWRHHQIPSTCCGWGRRRRGQMMITCGLVMICSRWRRALVLVGQKFEHGRVEPVWVQEWVFWIKFHNVSSDVYVLNMYVIKSSFENTTKYNLKSQNFQKIDHFSQKFARKNSNTCEGWVPPRPVGGPGWKMGVTRPRKPTNAWRGPGWAVLPTVPRHSGPWWSPGDGPWVLRLKYCMYLCYSIPTVYLQYKNFNQYYSIHAKIIKFRDHLSYLTSKKLICSIFLLNSALKHQIWCFLTVFRSGRLLLPNCTVGGISVGMMMRRRQVRIFVLAEIRRHRFAQFLVQFQRFHTGPYFGRDFATCFNDEL